MSGGAGGNTSSSPRRDVVSPVKPRLVGSSSVPSVGKKPGMSTPSGNSRSSSASFGPAAVKELETLRTKHAQAQEKIASLQGEIEKLKGARNSGEGADDFVVVSPSFEDGSGESKAGLDAGELEKLQAEKENVRIELEAAMADLEDNAKLVSELQEVITTHKSEKEELAKKHAEEMESLEEKLDKLASTHAEQIAKLTGESEEVMAPAN